MTVASATARSGPYAGNGSTTVFAYTFRILDETHLRLVLANAAGVESVLVLTTHYSVSGVGSSGGGNVTMATAPVTGETLTIVRDVPFTQETDYQNQGAYYAETVEDAIDLLTMTDQQLSERMGRSVTLPVASTTTDLTFPTPTAGTLIGWDAAGAALANYVPNSGDYLPAALVNASPELANLTGGEIQQLQNIDNTSISATQWGYLASAGTVGGALMAAGDAAAAISTLGLDQYLLLDKRLLLPSPGVDQGALVAVDVGSILPVWVRDGAFFGLVPNIVTSEYAVESSTSSTGYQDSGASVVITPRYSGKVAVICNVSVRAFEAAGPGAGMRIEIYNQTLGRQENERLVISTHTSSSASDIYKPATITAVVGGLTTGAEYLFKLRYRRNGGDICFVQHGSHPTHMIAWELP